MWVHPTVLCCVLQKLKHSLIVDESCSCSVSKAGKKKKKKNNGRMIYIPAALVEDVMIRWGAVLRIG